VWLRQMDRAILAAIIDKFDGGPVQVETLAAAVGEESETVVFDRRCATSESENTPSTYLRARTVKCESRIA
jgi:Holliday junction DNA resolvase RuvB-like protein